MNNIKKRKCMNKNKINSHEEVIAMLESLPEEERDIDSAHALAYAYFSIDKDLESPRSLYIARRTIELLEPFEDGIDDEEYFSEDDKYLIYGEKYKIEEEEKRQYLWDFLLGRAYFRTQNFTQAYRLIHRSIEQSLSLSETPEDSENVLKNGGELLNQILEQISCPTNDEPFIQRVEIAWEEFLNRDAELRAMLKTEPEKFSSTFYSIFSDVFPAKTAISFNWDKNGENPLLVFPFLHHPNLLFMFDYVLKKCPPKLKEYWRFELGLQPYPAVSVTRNGVRYTAEDILFWLKDLGKNRFQISLYCDKLAATESISEEEQDWSEVQADEDFSYFVGGSILNGVLGDLLSLRYIDRYVMLSCPLDEDTDEDDPGTVLSQLPQTLEALGMDINITTDSFLESSFKNFSLKVKKRENFGILEDVHFGRTRCPILREQFFFWVDNLFFDQLCSCGASAGLFMLRVSDFKPQKLWELQEKLIAYLSEDENQSFCFTGYSRGYQYAYVEFISWDLDKTLERAYDFSKKFGIWLGYQSFVKKALMVPLSEYPGNPEEN